MNSVSARTATLPTTLRPGLARTGLSWGRGMRDYPEMRRFGAISLVEGAINSVTIGNSTAAYSLGSSGATSLLVTDPRRDAYASPPQGVELVVPEAGRSAFSEPETFWAAAETSQFHDYAQQSRKMPLTAEPGLRGVCDGDDIESEVGTVHVLATPGRSAAAVSYVLDTDAGRVILTGDLLYGNGHLLDLHSLQDAVPEAAARGYHGYAARAGELILSLLRIAAIEPDLVLPAHGPAITRPNEAIAKLIGNLEGFLKLHFETDALRWYWGEESHRIRSRMVRQSLDVLPTAELRALPPDIAAIGNSRLIRSRTGAAFLIDAGDPMTLPTLRSMRKDGALQRLDGLWITHYHDDHTDYVNDVAEEFDCPVFYVEPVSQVIQEPRAFRLPCLPSRPIRDGTVVDHGTTLDWHEWRFTFEHFPGQTLYHGGLLATRDDGASYYFVGDSFTPTGLDDYCMQNRNLYGAGLGYEYCLNRLRALPRETWLLNQHVDPLFRFSSAQLDRMLGSVRERSGLLLQMCSWPDINYLVDESWATIHPYFAEAGVGEEVTLSVRVRNFALEPLAYRADWQTTDRAAFPPPSPLSRVVPPGETDVATVTLRAGDVGLHVIACDVRVDGRGLSATTEALLRVR